MLNGLIWNSTGVQVYFWPFSLFYTSITACIFFFPGWKYKQQFGVATRRIISLFVSGTGSRVLSICWACVSEVYKYHPEPTCGKGLAEFDMLFIIQQE